MRITTATAAIIAGALAAATLGLAGPSSAAPLSHRSTARADWQHGAKAVAAKQDHYWREARHQLAANGSHYAHQRHELASLISIPLTSTTAKQRATARRDYRALDTFFHTPGLYS